MLSKFILYECKLIFRNVKPLFLFIYSFILVGALIVPLYSIEIEEMPNARIVIYLISGVLPYSFLFMYGGQSIGFDVGGLYSLIYTRESYFKDYLVAKWITFSTGIILFALLAYIGSPNDIKSILIWMLLTSVMIGVGILIPIMLIAGILFPWKYNLYGKRLIVQMESQTSGWYMALGFTLGIALPIALFLLLNSWVLTSIVCSTIGGVSVLILWRQSKKILDLYKKQRYQVFDSIFK